MVAKRDQALKTARIVLRRVCPIQHGVTLVFFRVDAQADRTVDELERWATEHEHTGVTHAVWQEDFWGNRFVTGGVRIPAGKKRRKLDQLPTELPPSAVECVSNRFAAQLADLFSDTVPDDILPLALVLTLRSGANTHQTALGLQAELLHQLGCCSKPNRRSLFDGPVCDTVKGAHCTIELLS